MSMASSETVSYSTAKAACLFLAQFDPHTGYKMVWSKSNSDISVEGLEFKALPSGIHEYEATTVYLTHETGGILYYGLARFRQLNLNEATTNDRELVKMYSLGILLEPIKGKYWRPNEFGAIGWEHLDAVDDTLAKFLKDEQISHVEALYEKLTGQDHLDPPKPGAANPMLRHPLSQLPAVLAVVGPLIFPIYKAALLRKRIMIFNHSSKGAEIIRTPSDRDPEVCGALAYLISMLSVVPKDVRLENLDQEALFSQPLYTVGLHDMSSNFFEHHPGYIASTSDEILKYLKHLYDFAVVMPPNDVLVCQFVTSESPDQPLRATFNDYTKFLKTYRKLPNEGAASTFDDTSSIRTTNSMFSDLRFDIHGESRTIKFDHEPTWWLDEATSPMSWREYIWLAFAWFASAGTTNRAATEIALVEDETEPAEQRECVRQLLVQFTLIVGHFHKLTKKWFYLIDEIVSETIEDRANGQLALVTLELTHQDIIDMELDPYSHEDIEFVREFVLLYWDNVVEDVEVGLGFQGLCC